MSGDEESRVELVEGADGRGDDWLEHRATQVKASDDRCYLPLSGQLLRVANGVDDPGVAAAADQDEAAFAQPQHQRLVVEDQRVGLPAAVTEGIVPLEARLELRRSINLAGDQHRTVEQERGPALLDDLEACPLEGGATRRGKLGQIE